MNIAFGNNINSKQNLELYGDSKIKKNKELEDGSGYIEAAVYVETSVEPLGNPDLPVQFINCPPGKWVPTKQSTRCK